MKFFSFLSENKKTLFIFFTIVLLFFVCFKVYQLSLQYNFLYYDSKMVEKIEVQIDGGERHVLNNEATQTAIDFLATCSGVKRAIAGDSLEHNSKSCMYVYFSDKDKPEIIEVSPYRDKLYDCYDYSSKSKKNLCFISKDTESISEFIELVDALSSQ